MNDVTPESEREHLKQKAHEAFIRWQETTGKQLGHTINLILTLTTAALGFEVNLALVKNTSPPYLNPCAFFLSLLALTFSAAFGLAANYSRLWDFRWTTRAARGNEMHARQELNEDLTEKQKTRAQDREKYSNYAELVGKVTWWLVLLQFLAFLAGIATLAWSVRHSYWPG
jgi:hypothetical protein